MVFSTCWLGDKYGVMRGSESMNIWEILGISETRDTKEIRQAYGLQSKGQHPEEHPEAFAALRQAYEKALKWAKSSVQLPDTAHDSRSEGAIPPAAASTADGEVEDTRLDFDALFTQTAQQRTRKLMDSGAFDAIAERLGDRRRNNRAVWRDYFYSDEYFTLHIQPEFLPSLLEYLGQQDILPVNQLPKFFCVWLGIIGGVFHYEKETYNDGIARYSATKEWSACDALAPLYELLRSQKDAEYHQKEMWRDDFKLDRLCFTLFNDFLGKYPDLCRDGSDQEWYNAAASFVHTIRSNANYRQAHGEIGKMATFMVRHMNLPNPARRALYHEFDMEHYASSSTKRELKSLYEVLSVEELPDASVEKVPEQSETEIAYDKYGLYLKREVLEILCSVLSHPPKQEAEKAIAKIAALLEKPQYRQLFLAPPFIQWLHGLGKRQIGYYGGIWVPWADDHRFWAFMDLMAGFYQQYPEGNDVSGRLIPGLLESIAQRKGQGEKEQPERISYYGFPEEADQPFAELAQLDVVIQQKTQGFSYREHLLLATFAMARTEIITRILAPIDPKFERFQLSRIRNMPGYLLSSLLDEPIDSCHCDWLSIRYAVNNMVKQTFFEVEDVKAITDRPEIIFANYQSFLASWYHFTSFDFKPEHPTARPGMTSGLVLYPASMILRMDYEEGLRSDLLRLEWRRIQEDIDFLSQPRSYPALMERLHNYERLDMFIS